MKIHARFSLTETARVKMYTRAKSPRPNGETWEQVTGVRVKLQPVQGEPFGSATPGGQLEMVIANPDAAKVFNDAEIDQEFDVVFSLIERPDATEKSAE